MTWLSDDALDRLRAGLGAPEVGGERYRLVEPLGKGGMGTVYLAEDLHLGRQVALKVLSVEDPDGDLLQRLLREARVLARLEHPGIVPVHDVGRLADGRLFYTMRAVDGNRLDSWLGRGRSLPERLRLFTRVCEALAFAHSKGVLHRDLKPENVMVGAFGEVLLMDWGIAKLFDVPAAGPGDAPPPAAAATPSPMAVPGGALPTAHGTVLGTPGYMAPEQARGEVETLDVRADIYSLGVLLRFLLEDPPPTEATTLSLSEAGAPATTLARRRSSTPKALLAIAERAAAEAPEDRYSTALELAAEVQSFLDGRPVAAYPEGWHVRAGRFLARHRVAVILILAYVLARALVLLLAENP